MSAILCNAPQSLSSVSTLSIAPGGTASIYPGLIDVEGNVIAPTGVFSFRSANSYICTVDSSTGVVTGVNVGQTEVRVTYSNAGLAGSVRVIVTNSPLKVGPLSPEGYGFIGAA